ncbi:hypothetical protein Ciccas_004452 [Cichlidogyrus casuarinus]|uniref:Adenylate kinase isoenzyme 6 homolog n=1 Tax=Cichlidogyrus casuarinus TaxID=1844966 RepID=A0ABD2QBI5_9PLAT
MRPNILITGMPGTGKTTLCKVIAEKTDMNLISINDLAQKLNAYSGADDAHDAKILDDDRIIDEIEETINDGGHIIEYHSSDWFPENWFHAIFVLRTFNDVLFQRLNLRGYSQEKILDTLHLENTEFSIEEARESYNNDLVHELRNDNMDQFQSNVDFIVNWLSEHQDVSSLSENT